MNTLRERLGVAVEADAARYSGDEFASSRGVSIAGRVRRRRAVRAAGYGGGAMLAVGAIAVGGARVPWESLGGGGLNVGASDCVSASPSAATGIGPTSVSSIVTAELDGSDLAFTDIASGEVMTFRVVDGGVISTDGSGTSTLRQHDDGSYSFQLPDLSYVSFAIADGESSVEVISIDMSQPSEAPVPPSPSADCVTAEPSASASVEPEPEPSWGGDLAALPGDIDSPFQCGFVFPTWTGSTGVITVSEPVWLSADEAEARIRGTYADPDAVLLEISGDEVPLVTYSTIASWRYEREGGLMSGDDPAHYGVEVFGESNDVAVTTGVIDGIQFVLVADDTVIATPVPEAIPTGVASQYFESSGQGSGMIYGLDLTSGFTACPGVDPAVLADAQPVAVAGTKGFDADGTVDGPYYAWQYITRG